MNRGIIRALSVVASVAPLYLIPTSNAQADDWGCQVLLCLSNPGGATQFAECRPPVEKLWRHLEKGGSFPICTGVGFSASRPGYEPYYCDAGFNLTRRQGDGGGEVGCVSQAPQTVSNSLCFGDRDGGGSQLGQWGYEDGHRICKAVITKRPNVRERPRFVDVTIDGVGRQRVWF